MPVGERWAIEVSGCSLAGASLHHLALRTVQADLCVVGVGVLAVDGLQVPLSHPVAAFRSLWVPIYRLLPHIGSVR